MNLSPPIDMREVTRLTRAGKLGEALRALQGRRSETPPAAPAVDAAPSAQGFSRAHRLISGLAKAGVTRPGGLVARQAKAPPVPEGARFETRSFANAAGSRDYKVYVPSRHAGESLAVVVMLHGCTQDPDDFAAGTRMNEVAEERGFLVVYPCQPQSANLQKCWNWFNASEQRRDAGEPSLIAGIAREVVAAFCADPARVYVAGLSAGGAAAAVLAATYPDLFAAVGVHSGLACGAARDMPSAFAAMNGGGVAAPRTGQLVPTIVFHGDADKTVNPVNGEQVMAQVSPKAELTETAIQGTTPDGMAYTRRVYTGAGGASVGERWTLHDAGHAWSGGSPEGSYTAPRGPDASREMARFFLSHARR